MITGHVGSGKSTALRSAMYTLDVSRYRFIYLAHSGLTPKEFYSSSCTTSMSPRNGGWRRTNASSSKP
ncbi:AAA family ATPase [Heliobacterium chlorum]|uniref:AAA family ATPase n=1 Tax=Heliobacterium chlorum TaxID=2698 RepID=UPI00311AB6BD